jgi:VIT1/CCC1 family predicted Fe2+/Mn2+ transporter
MLKHSAKTGISFGLTSGVITTLGLMVGLHSGTNSRSAVIGGILTIAVADAFSDALGIHISEESENKHTSKEIWESTFFTFIAKFIFSISFVFPVIFLKLNFAMIVNIFYGIILLALFSFYLAKEQGAARWKVIAEHVTIAVIVVIISHYIGEAISMFFS